MAKLDCPWLALLGLILLGLVLLVDGRPTHEDTESLETSYARFFNLEELIQKINIKRFKEFQKSGDENDKHIPAIDLTQDAIANDAENPADNEIDDTPIEYKDSQTDPVNSDEAETTSVISE